MTTDELIGVLGLIVLYFVGAEQGATSIVSGHCIHELVHDGRHLLSFPCHRNFRIGSLGTQLVTWATIGMLFGPLVYRRLETATPVTH